VKKLQFALSLVLLTCVVESLAQSQSVQPAPTNALTLQQYRLPPIPESQQTDAQKKAAAEFVTMRKTPLIGPFISLLRSPELMLRAAAVGDYLRFRDALPPKLNEFAILIVSREWTQNFEWTFHYPIAIKAGLDPEIVKALAEGRRPAKMSEEEEIVYEFSTELQRNKCVSDATYSRAVAKLGEQGMMDLVGVNGYFTLMAMTLNTARTPALENGAPVLAPLPH
jgi:4-carboxymuconolactone decarboxylase